MDAGVKVEDLRQNLLRNIPFFFNIRYSLLRKDFLAGSLPLFVLSSFDAEGTRDGFQLPTPFFPLSRFPLLPRLHLPIFFSFSFFPRDKPRQQIFTDGHRGGRSNKCLIVLTILSVLHEFYRVLLLSFVKQRSFFSLLLLLLLLPALNPLMPFRSFSSLSFSSNSLWNSITIHTVYNVFVIVDSRVSARYTCFKGTFFFFFFFFLINYSILCLFFSVYYFLVLFYS